MKKVALLLGLVALTATGTALARLRRRPGPAFYVDGTALPDRRHADRPVAAPARPRTASTRSTRSPGQPLNVATAAPGDRDYNGGRWMVHAIAYNTSWAATVAAHDANGSGDLDSEAEVLAALADAGPGGATDAGVVKQFVCPVIKLE